MKRMLVALVALLAFTMTPIALTAAGASAEDAACDGADGGVDTAFDAATADGRAGDNVPAGQVDFVVNTVTDSNPQVPPEGCP